MFYFGSVPASSLFFVVSGRREGSGEGSFKRKGGRGEGA